MLTGSLGDGTTGSPGESVISRNSRPERASRTSFSFGNRLMAIVEGLLLSGLSDLVENRLERLAEGLGREGLGDEEECAGRRGQLAHLGRALGCHEPEVHRRATGAKPVK